MPGVEAQFVFVRVLRPTAQLTQYVDLWERMWGDDYVTATPRTDAPESVARRLHRD